MEDDRIRYVAIELSVNSDSAYEVLEELEEHLKNCGYNHFFSHDPFLTEIYVLLIDEEQTGYIDTILEDRNVDYKYR